MVGVTENVLVSYASSQMVYGDLSAREFRTSNEFKPEITCRNDLKMYYIQAEVLVIDVGFLIEDHPRIYA